MSILVGNRVLIHRWDVAGLVVSTDEMEDRPIKVMLEDHLGGYLRCKENQFSILPDAYIYANLMLKMTDSDWRAMGERQRKTFFAYKRVVDFYREHIE